MDVSRVKKNKLRVDWSLPLRDAFVESFDSIIDYAISRAKDAEADPEKAVHEFRKSIRRGRSLLRLLHDAHPEFDRAELNQSLREAFEPTSALRDADVLLPVIEKWARLSPDQALVEEVIDSLTQHRDAVGSHDAVAILVGQVERLHHCKWSLRKHMPETLSWDDMRAGLGKSYGRCRARRQYAATSGSDIAVHDWRKRSKEIRYQTELLAAGTSFEPVNSYNIQFADLAQNLGEATDLQIFSDFLRHHQAEGAAAWQVQVYEEYLRSLGACILKSNVLFAAKPKAFASQIVEGVLAGLESDETHDEAE